MHLGIIPLVGLFNFSLVMIAADTLVLRDSDYRATKADLARLAPPHVSGARRHAPRGSAPTAARARRNVRPAAVPRGLLARRVAILLNCTTRRARCGQQAAERTLISIPRSASAVWRPGREWDVDADRYILREGHFADAAQAGGALRLVVPRCPGPL